MLKQMISFEKSKDQSLETLPVLLGSIRKKELYASIYSLSSLLMKGCVTNTLIFSGRNQNKLTCFDQSDEIIKQTIVTR